VLHNIQINSIIITGETQKTEIISDAYINSHINTFIQIWIILSEWKNNLNDFQGAREGGGVQYRA
jgi:hypothetical protein